MAKTRKGGRKSKKRGGSAAGGLMAAIKKALPSMEDANLAVVDASLVVEELVAVVNFINDKL